MFIAIENIFANLNIQYPDKSFYLSKLHTEFDVFVSHAIYKVYQNTKKNTITNMTFSCF